MSSAVTKEPNSGLLAYLADQILAWLQERCSHPGQMVAVDILEGSGGDVEVSYCRRCGAVKTVYRKPTAAGPQFRNTWRSPNPNLWRGK